MSENNTEIVLKIEDLTPLMQRSVKRDVCNLKTACFQTDAIITAIRQRHNVILYPDDISRLLDESMNEDLFSAPTVAQMRALENRRLDDLLRQCMADASEGNYQAANTAVRIMERRAKMLGLDAPQSHRIIDWRTELLDLVRLGKVTLDQVRNEFGQAVADELIESRGTGLIESRTGTEARDRPDEVAEVSPPE